VRGYCIKEFKFGFIFIELLLVLAIILFLFYKAIDLYFKKTSINKETENLLLEQGINTTNYKSILDSSRNKIQDIQTQRAKEIDNIK
jgi:type II secretory pathway pseudopilin PulG